MVGLAPRALKEIVRPRRHGALLCGPSISPLEAAPRIDYATRTTSCKSQGKDPSFDAAAVRARTVPNPEHAVRGLYMRPLWLCLGQKFR